MKISPGMVEAGVAAMARIKKQYPSDESIVAYVFSAMHLAMEKDQKRLEGTTTPEVYKHQDWPSWRFGPEGESELFESADDVPEGWSEHPPAAVVAKRRPGRPAKVKDGTVPVP